MEHREYVRNVESSNTAVLFIHGIVGTPAHFERFIPAVPENWSIYNMLLDGHGGTVADFSHTSMDKWKNQVRNTVDSLSEKYDNIIIAAHSMGTLFAIENAVRVPEKIKMLFLLAVPLKICVKFRALKNSVKVVLDRVGPNDIECAAAQAAFGITPTKKLWKYIAWSPRYIELFKESKAVRRIMMKLKTRSYVFQSGKDELIPRRICGYFRNNPNIRLEVLKNSCHYYYDKEDLMYIISKFKEAIDEVK